MGRIGKNLLYAMAFAIAGFLPGCEPDEPPVPKDTTAPKINIISPLEQKVYDSNTIPFQWAIEESNFKSAWYSTDNEQTKSSIGKSGTINLSLSNGSYNLISYADDNSNNSSRKNVNFSVNKITDNTPPKITISSPIKDKIYDVNEISLSWDIEEANFKSAWYSLDNGTKVSIAKSGTEDKYIENGNHKIVIGADDLYSNASKDSVIFSVDKHDWLYLVNPFIQPNDTTKPIVWNNFKTLEERSTCFYDRLYNYDKTDTLNIPGWVCTDYARTLAIHFNGYPIEGLENNNWHNIPLYLVYFFVSNAPIHTVGGVILGDNVSNINNWRFIESQTDSTYNLNKLKQGGVFEIQINYTLVMENEIQGKYLQSVPMLNFILNENNEWVDSGYRSSEINLIEER